MSIEELEKLLVRNNQPRFRLDQITKAVYQDAVSNFSEISNLPKDLREILDKELKILPFEAESVLTSIDKQSMKALLGLADGNTTETVIMSVRPEVWSVCLSCQVGCPMQCAFCATGDIGFKRNLTSEEIYGQVLFWKRYIKQNNIPGRLANVVYMGMGEPFLNWPEVKKSLKILMDRKYFNFGSRSISISTVGVKGAVEKILADFPQVNLAVSLHFPQDAQRARFMPADKIFSLEDLRDSLKKYFERSNRKVFLEYILLYALNDSDKDMQDLVRFIKSFKKPYLLHVNLIRYNQTSNQFKHSPHYQMQKFKSFLLDNGINVTERKSLGSDIQGACGQLAGGKGKPASTYF